MTQYAFLFLSFFILYILSNAIHPHLVKLVSSANSNLLRMTSACCIQYNTGSAVQEHLQEHVVGRELVQHAAQELVRHKYGRACQPRVGLRLPAVAAQLDHSADKINNCITYSILGLPFLSYRRGAKLPSKRSLIISTGPSKGTSEKLSWSLCNIQHTKLKLRKGIFPILKGV